MAELTYNERLQPSLLDRLADQHPEKKSESRTDRVLSITRLRESVIRDLEWLLNTEHLASSTDLDDYPQVRRSVLNFGRNALSGVTATGAKAGDLQKKIRQCILWFEPRIIPETLHVTLLTWDDEAEKNSLSLEIDGQLWAQPLPLSLFLRTEIDLETGDVNIIENQR